MPNIAQQIPNYEVERARSEEFFTRRDSYNRFYLIGALTILDCIDPRAKKCINPIRTSIQTTGGRPGEGVDQAIAHHADTGTFINPFEGAEIAKEAHPWAIGDSHINCKFLIEAESVYREVSSPSDQTSHRMDYMIDYYGWKDFIGDSILSEVRDKSKYQEEYAQQHGGLEEMADFTGTQHPQHNNVAEMEGESNPGFWIDNHSPYLGLNREKKHREAGLVVKAYHSSLHAALRETMSAKLPGQQRRYRLAAALYRNAATRTILGNAYDVKYIDILPDDAVEGGLRFEELDG
jgi:hypothetical protein